MNDRLHLKYIAQINLIKLLIVSKLMAISSYKMFVDKQAKSLQLLRRRFCSVL